MLYINSNTHRCTLLSEAVGSYFRQPLFIFYPFVDFLVAKLLIN